MHVILYLEAPPDIIDGHVSFIVLVDKPEPFNVHLDLLFGQVDRHLVARRPVHHQAHFGGQKLIGSFQLFLELDLQFVVEKENGKHVINAIKMSAEH